MLDFEIQEGLPLAVIDFRRQLVMLQNVTHICNKIIQKIFLENWSTYEPSYIKYRRFFVPIKDLEIEDLMAELDEDAYFALDRAIGELGDAGQLYMELKFRNKELFLYVCHVDEDNDALDMPVTVVEVVKEESAPRVMTAHA
jgi:hypothetical protein